ncbi:MAG: hypothetical protein ACRDL7_13465, partial [Gaiellaceae bacterium]
MRARVLILPALALALAVLPVRSHAAVSVGPATAEVWNAALPAPPEAFAAAPEPALAVAALPLGVWPLEPPVLTPRISGNGQRHSNPGPLNAERARVMLQSLTVPGWGQVTTGHHGAATTFFLIETGIWVSFAAFEIQESMRMESSIHT